MKKNPEQLLMEKIDQGIRAGVRHALLKHKREGTAIVVWEKGKIKVIPPDKIKIK
jgi:hypothetical protein